MLDKTETKNLEDDKLEAFRSTWRPAIGWLYILICLFDFLVFPVLWGLANIMYIGNVGQAWEPLTLDGAGLFHISMGGILGISAWTRGKEKISENECYCNREMSYMEGIQRRSSGTYKNRNRKIPQNEEEIL